VVYKKNGRLKTFKERLKKLLMATMNKTLGQILELMMNINLMPDL
jgi:hypothetical protein